MSTDVDYTADEIDGADCCADNVVAANVEQLAAMLQDKIKRWEWEEATAGLRDNAATVSTLPPPRTVNRATLESAAPHPQAGGRGQVRGDSWGCTLLFS